MSFLGWFQKVELKPKETPSQGTPPESEKRPFGGSAHGYGTTGQAPTPSQPHKPRK